MDKIKTLKHIESIVECIYDNDDLERFKYARKDKKETKEKIKEMIKKLNSHYDIVDVESTSTFYFDMRPTHYVTHTFKCYNFKEVN